MALNNRKIMDASAPNRSTGSLNGVLNWETVRFSWAFLKRRKKKLSRRSCR
ncbi:hypothetical protein WAK64_13875 [Bacillus spongiae]|uniref:Uncharacterized protein n=1 Tax=Bacillus spongiae TaxID=2683610 RepID=A0ABU8HG62_9BACI